MKLLPDLLQLPTLETPRLCLRWLQERDLAALDAIHTDARSMRYWNSVAWTHPDRAAGLLAGIRDSFERRELFRWGVARRDGDGVIGLCSLQRLDPAARRCEVGFVFGSPSWGQGFAHESLARLVAFAFDDLEMARLGADADVLNTASCRLLRRLGFADVGVREAAAHFELLAADWRGLPVGGESARRRPPG